MESATILTSHGTGLSSILLSNFPEGPEYEKYQHYIDARGEVLPISHRDNDSCCDLGIGSRNSNETKTKQLLIYLYLLFLFLRAYFGLKY